jgi:hypothetical protein
MSAMAAVEIKEVRDKRKEFGSINEDDDAGWCSGRRYETAYALS